MVGELQVTEGGRLLQFNIVMGKIVGAVAAVNEGEPALAVRRGLQGVLVGKAVTTAAHGLHVLIGEIDLNGADLVGLAQIRPQPFPRAPGLGAPPGTEAFVEGLVGGVILIQRRGGLGGLMEGEEMPARVGVGEGVVHLMREELWVVTAVGVGVNETVLHLGGEQAEAALKDMVDADGHGVHLPVVAPLVREQAPVTRPPHEARGLVDNRAVLAVGEGAHGGVRDRATVAVARVLGAGDGVGEVVSAVDLVHPGAFQVGAAALHLVDVPDPLKAAGIAVALKNVHGALQYLGGILGIQLADVEGMDGAESLVAVEGAVVVHEEGGIVPVVGPARVDPGVGVAGVIGVEDTAPLTMGDIDTVPHHHGTGGEETELGLLFEIHLDKLPIRQIGGHPVARAVGSEKVVFVLVQHHGGVGGLPGAHGGLVLVVDAYGVTDGFRFHADLLPCDRTLVGHHSSSS